MKVRVTINGEPTIVRFNKPRTGGTLLMTSKFHKDKSKYTRKVKHTNG